MSFLISLVIVAFVIALVYRYEKKKTAKFQEAMKIRPVHEYDTLKEYPMPKNEYTVPSIADVMLPTGSPFQSISTVVKPVPLAKKPAHKNEVEPTFDSVEAVDVFDTFGNVNVFGLGLVDTSTAPVANETPVTDTPDFKFGGGGGFDGGGAGGSWDSGTSSSTSSNSSYDHGSSSSSHSSYDNGSSSSYSSYDSGGSSDSSSSSSDW